jgi:hypothetical protein
MALVLRVGTPADLFTEPFASQLVRILDHHFGSSMNLSGASESDGWASIELGYTFLRQLQDRAANQFGEEGLPHLLSMSSWRGAFLPVETTIGELSEIWQPDQPIAIASLITLNEELRLLAPAMNVPLDPASCEQLINEYISDDDRVDKDPDVQALTQLIIGASIGLARHQPLWVVK